MGGKEKDPFFEEKGIFRQVQGKIRRETKGLNISMSNRKKKELWKS